MNRSAIILLLNNQVALIERVREGQTYYLFPGGGIEGNETSEHAAVREAWEELGVHVELNGLVAVATFAGNKQYFYYATIIAGEWGSGTGDEFNKSPFVDQDSYRPVWLPLRDLAGYDVRPKALAYALVTEPQPFVVPRYFAE